MSSFRGWIKMKKLVKVFLIIFCVTSIAAISFLIINNLNYYVSNDLPVKLDPITVIYIDTPDKNNPATKVITFKTSVLNEGNEPIYLKFYFSKKDGAEKWYPYYKIIPDLHVTEMYHIEPGIVEHIESELIVNTDDSRLITSHLTDVNVKCEIIE